MSLCIAIAATVLTIPATTFSLSWVHSVEKVEWREEWAVTGSGLELRQASVKGSGAGMEPGEGAVLNDGWWRWKPSLAPVAELRLASSGATPGGWTLCHAGGCQTLGDAPGREAVLSACKQDSRAVEPSR
ncbi:MAG: DUF1850 domain-containing protein [Rhizobium sp.]|nr:DUF1850 domain-containing protein [Rhizobium sp.]